MTLEEKLELLKKIPFANIPYDETVLADVKAELLENTEWYSYLPPHAPDTEEFRKAYANYKGLALTTFDPDLDKTKSREDSSFRTPHLINGVEYKRYHDVPIEYRRTYETTAAINFPKTMEFIRSITNKPILAKLGFTKGRHKLWWHSHHMYDRFGTSVIHGKETFITHLPLLTHSDVYHFVNTKKTPTTPVFDFAKKEEYLNDPDIKHMNFPEGKLTFFSGYNLHGYVNFSDSPRLSLIIYNDCENNPELEKLIDLVIENYTGEFLEDPWN